jgi:hypothetical protein
MFCVIHSLCREQQYMLEMVKERRNADKVEQRYDLFSGLLDASQNEADSEAAITDEELIGGYSKPRSLDILEKHLARLPRKHVCFSFCWTRGKFFPFVLRCCRERFRTDHSAYIMLYICLVGSVS